MRAARQNILLRLGNLERKARALYLVDFPPLAAIEEVDHVMRAAGAGVRVAALVVVPGNDARSADDFSGELGIEPDALEGMIAVNENEVELSAFFGIDIV